MSVSLQSAQSAPSTSSSSFQTVQLPIEDPVADVQEAVQKLKECSPAELKRARRHHRRALEALQMGGYEALSGNTRQQLTERLQTDLEALNRALNKQREDGPPRESEQPETNEEPAHVMSSSLLQEVLPWNW